MKTNVLEARMRSLESFHGLRVPDGAWIILRIDGCGFSRLTAQAFEKPFDERFSRCMVAAARLLVERFQAIYAYTESDEVSLLLPRDSNLYDREVEKLVSISAGVASAAFSFEAGRTAFFDSRAIVASRTTQAIDYFRWRQGDAGRCALNGWCYWTLRKSGASKADATQRLAGTSATQKHDLLFSSGINFAELPAWQRRGIGLFFRDYEKEANNPLTGAKVAALRRGLFVDRDLPIREGYSDLLRGIIAARSNGAVNGSPY